MQLANLAVQSLCDFCGEQVAGQINYCLSKWPTILRQLSSNNCSDFEHVQNYHGDFARDLKKD